MNLSHMRRAAFALVVTFGPVAITTTTTTGCATVTSKSTKKPMAKKKEEKSKNYSLYRNKDIDWKILRQGQREMGGAALDSY